MSIIEEIEGTVVSFKQGDKLIKFDIPEVFALDEANLSNDMMSQAALYAFFAAKLAEAEKELAKVEFTLDMEYAKADEDFRLDLDTNNRKYTEAVIKSLITRDESYQKVKNKQIEAQYVVDLLKAIVKALQMRAEMLISLGANMRQEMGMTGMSTNTMDKSVSVAVQRMKTSKQASKFS